MLYSVFYSCSQSFSNISRTTSKHNGGTDTDFQSLCGQGQAWYLDCMTVIVPLCYNGMALCVEKVLFSSFYIVVKETDITLVLLSGVVWLVAFFLFFFLDQIILALLELATTMQWGKIVFNESENVKPLRLTSPVLSREYLFTSHDTVWSQLSQCYKHAINSACAQTFADTILLFSVLLKL